MLPILGTVCPTHVMSVPSMSVFRGHLKLSSSGVPSRDFYCNLCCACCHFRTLKSFLLLTNLLLQYWMHRSLNRECVVSKWPDVLQLVILRDLDLVTSDLQLVVLNLAEDLKVRWEEQFQTTLLEVVVSVIRRQITVHSVVQPLQGVCKFTRLFQMWKSRPFASSRCL